MKKVILIGGCFVLLLLSACSNNQLVESSNGNENSGIKLNFPTKEDQWVKDGTETYQDFLLDNILHTSDLGDIHYNVYIFLKTMTVMKPMPCILLYRDIKDYIFKVLERILKQKHLDLLLEIINQK